MQSLEEQQMPTLSLTPNVENNEGKRHSGNHLQTTDGTVSLPVVLYPNSLAVETFIVIIV